MHIIIVFNYIIALIAASTLIYSIIYRMCTMARLIGLGMQESDKMARISVIIMLISMLSWGYVIGYLLNK